MKIHLPNRSKFFAALLVTAFLNGSAALADNNPAWTTLGAMPAPKWDGTALIFHSHQGTLAVTPLGDDVIRVRFTTAKAFGRDHSYAVVNQDLGNSDAKVQIGSRSTALTTRSLKVTIQHAPLRI